MVQNVYGRIIQVLCNHPSTFIQTYSYHKVSTRLVGYLQTPSASQIQQSELFTFPASHDVRLSTSRLPFRNPSKPPMRLDAFSVSRCTSVCIPLSTPSPHSRTLATAGSAWRARPLSSTWPYYLHHPLSRHTGSSELYAAARLSFERVRTERQDAHGSAGSSSAARVRSLCFRSVVDAGLVAVDAFLTDHRMNLQVSQVYAGVSLVLRAVFYGSW